jgi:acetyl esterase
MVESSEPDPEVQVLLEMMDRNDAPPTHALTAEGARKQFEELTEQVSVENVASMQDITTEGPGDDLTLRLYRPETNREGPLPVLVFLHGGGFVIGDLDSHDNICCALANRAECLVVSVEYRLAPEHPFPAALEDTYAALEWVDEHIDAMGGDPDRIALGGDSAGGNLTAGATLLSEDRNGPDITHQLLIYPAVNAAEVYQMESYEENANGYFLEAPDMMWFDEKYVQDEIHARNEYASPLLARDLSGLPPATVVTAGFDPLRDEGIEYAERLEEAGVPVEHHHYDGMIHGFVSMTGMVSQADDALDVLADDLRTAF